MKKQSMIRETLVFITKISIHLLTLLIFILGFSKNYAGLGIYSRTLAVTIAAFVIFTSWLTSVYGKIDIGIKKSSPIFQTLSLNLLITDALTFIALKVMTFHDAFNISSDLIILLSIYLLQLLVGRILIFTANSIYFISFIPEKTIIINQDSTKLEKIKHYLLSHEKQFDLVGIYENASITEIDFNDIKNVFLLGNNHEFMNELIYKCMYLDTKVIYEVDIPYVSLNRKESVVVDDVLLFEYKSNNMSQFQEIVKRSLDILFSLIGTIVALPFMILVAIMIKLDDGGPLFFTQERLTKDHRPFKIYKFRSMKINSSDQPAEKDDDRITKAGKIIRKLRLDELPQLINILIGDMSIVGPRPESLVISNEIVKEVPEFSYRLKVKAGLTGTAQILGKYNTEPRDKLLFDLYYIENYSILYDLRLMFQTLVVFIKKDSTEGFEKKNNN